MKAHEIELILIEGLAHTPETRIDFYLSKAKENNIDPINFCLALDKAFIRCRRYVNTLKYDPCPDIDEVTGKKKYYFKTIDLETLTNGQLIGELCNKNIEELLLPSLLKMKLQLIQDERTKMTEILNGLKVQTKTNKTGFVSILREDQIQSLFDQLKGKYIDKTTDPSHFKAIFRPGPLPPDYLPIKKTKKCTGTLLAYLISELFQKENQSDYWYIAENCFDKAKSLKQSLYNSYTYNTKLDKKPRGYKEIDTILKNIYRPLQ